MKNGNRETYGRETGDPNQTSETIVEIGMIGWDRFPTATAASLGPHIHPATWEICYLADGSVDWWAAEERHTLRRGDLFVTRPGEPHGGLHSVMQPCELYWIQVFFDRLPEEMRLALAGLNHRVFAGSPGIPALFEALLAEHRHDAPFVEIARRAAFYSLLIAALRDAAQAALPSESPLSPVIAAALRLLENDILGALSIADVAQQVGLSAPRLVERFLQEVGETPGEWRMHRRLDAAKTALRESGATVTEIAFRFGFASSQYFATAFKRHVGLSPGEWRGLHR